MITAFCVVVNKFFNDSAPFTISSLINGVVIFLQKRRITVCPPRFTIFQRRSSTKNGMAVKTSDDNFSHIIKVNTALANFCVSVAGLFRKKAILKFLFIFCEFMSIYDDQDFSPFILEVYIPVSIYALESLPAHCRQ